MLLSLFCSNPEIQSRALFVTLHFSLSSHPLFFLLFSVSFCVFWGAVDGGTSSLLLRGLAWDLQRVDRGRVCFLVCLSRPLSDPRRARACCFTVLLFLGEFISFPFKGLWMVDVRMYVCTDSCITADMDFMCTIPLSSWACW